MTRESGGFGGLTDSVVNAPCRVYVELSPGKFVEGLILNYNITQNNNNRRYASRDGDIAYMPGRTEMEIQVTAMVQSTVEMPLPSSVREQLIEPRVRGTAVSTRTAVPLPGIREPALPEIPEIPERELSPTERRFQALDLEGVDDDA